METLENNHKSFSGLTYKTEIDCNWQENYGATRRAKLKRLISGSHEIRVHKSKEPEKQSIF